MPEVSFRAFCPCAHYIDTTLEERSKFFVRAVLELVPLLLNESLQLRKELFDRVKVRRVGWQVQQLDASITAQLFDSLGVVKGSIVHDEDREEAAL